MSPERKRRYIALLVLITGVIMFALMLIFVLPYFMSEKKYGEMQAALNEGDYYKVFRIAEFLLQQDPSTIQAYYFRGQAYLALKKYENAERDLQKVIALNAQYSNMRNVGIQLGEVYHKHGLALMYTEPDKAYRLFKKALKYLPREMNLKKDIAQASYLVGQAVEEKDNNKAVTYYREAIKYYPEKANYKAALGRGLLHLGKTEEAVELLTAAVQQDADLRTPRNISLLKDGLWRLAIAKEREYFEGKITDVTQVTKSLDQIIELEDTSKDALLEKLALAVNTNNLKNAEEIINTIKAKGILLPLDDIAQLVNTDWQKQPQTLFTGSSETDVELKLDSDLVWSSTGTQIILKAMDKTSSQAKILVYDLTNGSANVLQTKENIAWGGKLFAPSADGVIITSDKSIYKIKEDTLEKLAEVNGKILDVSKDGQSALVADGSRLYRYNFQEKQRYQVYLGRLKGQIAEAAYSPQNKRIAVAAGNTEDESAMQLGIVLGKSRAKAIAADNISSLGWSWDGQKAYYISKQKGISSVFSLTIDAALEPQAITKPELNAAAYKLSPTDEYFVFKGISGKEILWLSDTLGKMIPIAPRFGQFGKFIWSPDGTKVAYLFSPVKGGSVRLEIIDVKRFKEVR